MYSLFRPWLFQLEAERAHHLALQAARWGTRLGGPLLRPLFGFEDERLRQTLWGHTFANPIGLAAGFDKNARHLPFWETLGFGFAEVGSVSAQPALGNPRPRAFRLREDEALINRMGLNNEGAEMIAARIRKSLPNKQFPLGINLAKTHDPTILGDAALADFVASFRACEPLADYIALNISCPNTAEGKTFEDPAALDELLAAIYAERTTACPILIKCAPTAGPSEADLASLAPVIDVAQRYGVDGYIATNTASDRQGLQTDPTRLAEIGRGGLSGPPLAARATAVVRFIYQQTGGTVPIIGVGGVDSAEAAYAKIRAGASLVQLYTGLVYHGPGLIKRLKQGLVQCLKRDGFSTLEAAIGADHTFVLNP